MKTQKNIFYLILLCLFTIIGCEEEGDENIKTSNSHYPLTDSSLNLVYENFSTYPIAGNIQIPTPTFDDIPVIYNFGVNSVSSTAAGVTITNQVSIDNLTGQIAFNNNQNIFIPGTYTVSVNLSTVDGISVFPDALTVDVLDVPVELAYTYSDSQDVGFLESGVVATVSYTDISPSGSEITSVSYSLEEAPAGFSINGTTGEVSKTTTANSGMNSFTVIAQTNLGVKTFDNLFSITVLNPPTLSYTQSTGIDPLTKVTVSPFTTYTSATPVLEGMDALGGYELILPAEIPASSMVIDANGVISFPDGHIPLPEGDYEIGVEVTNGGGSTVSFNSLFILSVEERWDGSVIDNPNLKTGTWPTGWGVKTGLLSTHTGWGGWYITSNRGDNLILQHNTVHILDAYMLSDIPTNGLTGKIRVSFAKSFEFNSVITPTLYYGSSKADYDADALDLSNWTTAIPSTDDSWTSASTIVTVDWDTNMGNNLYLLWQCTTNEEVTGGNGFALMNIDSVSIEVSQDFTPEEE